MLKNMHFGRRTGNPLFWILPVNVPESKRRSVFPFAWPKISVGIFGLRTYQFNIDEIASDTN